MTTGFSNFKETIVAGKKQALPATESATAELGTKVCEKELKRLHVELVKLQQWVGV